jgi:hypothetical protein
MPAMRRSSASTGERWSQSRPSDIDQWKTFSEARQAMLPNFRQEDAAARATSDVFHELRFP